MRVLSLLSILGQEKKPVKAQGELKAQSLWGGESLLHTASKTRRGIHFAHFVLYMFFNVLYLLSQLDALGLGPSGAWASRSASGSGGKTSEEQDGKEAEDKDQEGEKKEEKDAEKMDEKDEENDEEGKKKKDKKEEKETTDAQGQEKKGEDGEDPKDGKGKGDEDTKEEMKEEEEKAWTRWLSLRPLVNILFLSGPVFFTAARTVQTEFLRVSEIAIVRCLTIVPRSP